MALEVGSAVLRAVVPSLLQLLKYEWCLNKTVKDGLRRLKDELMSMHAFLGDVSGMPPDQLESQVKIRAGQVRELSHAIETRLHSFVARIESIKGTLVSAPSKLVINHQMDSYIKETLIKVKELRDRHGKYPLKSALESTSMCKGGTHMFAMDNRESNPVGLEGAIADLTNKLSKDNHVSIVGMGGMGKTTLARAVYNKMKGDFEGDSDCRAFVHVGQRADMKKILTNIFDELHIEIYGHEPDQRQLTNQLQDFLVDKRCLIVIDDVWDEGTWSLVEGVFKGSARIKIITTTRNLKVAEEVGGVYKIKRLSPNDSKKLLRAKVGSKSHDKEFDTVSDKILLKCGGVPMAITIIGSLLAKSQSKEWHREYVSIGFDEDKEDGAFEHIRKVLSYSYYALPYEIKKCFLYLSLFPEDQMIERNMLIWRWVAEGLVPGGLFETGEKYFIELLDRCMILWAVSPCDVGQGGCRLHGLMLDLIRDLSSSEEENFSTVLGMKQENTSQTGPIHRLAIHEGQNQNTSLEVGEVLSFYAGTCTSSSFPALRKFKRLRVIDLERCDLSAGDCKLEHLGKLDGLGYIGLVGTPVAELPKKIGRLKLLQTLDVTATGITKVPPFVQELVTLRCLRAGNGTSMMGQVEKLTSLEELWLHSADKSPDFAVGLRKLSKMRVLVIHFDKIDDGMQEALVESLHELKKLRVLQVWSDAGEKVRLGCWEGSVPSRQLRQMLLFGVIVPRRMPWIDRLYVPELSKLLLQVETLGAQDMKILGQMPSLGSLYLHSEDNCLSYIAGKDEFEELEYLNTNIELICGNGGLKKMQQLEVGGIWAGRDVGLQGNMPLLKRVTYHLDCQGCLPLRVEKAEEEIRKARETHPKRPDLTIRRWNNAVTEAHHIMELTKGTFPVTPRLDRPRALPSPSRARAILRYVGNPANLNMLSEGLARLEPAIGAPPALRVGDATDATASPSQGPAFFENFFKKYLEDPEFIAFATQNEGLSSPGSASASENLDAGLARNGDGAGPSREPPPPEVDADNVLCWLNSPDGVALSSSMAARRGVHHDAYLMILQTCLRNPKMLATMSSAVRNGDFSDMASWLENNTVMMDLMYPDIFDYFAKQHMDRQSLLPQYADDERQADIAISSEAQGMGAPLPNKLGRPLPYWLNTPDGAACVSEGAAKFGTNDVPYERVFKKCVLNPELIATIHSAVQNDDDSEFNQLMDQLIGPEIMNYFSEQDTDEEDMDGPPKRDIAGYLLYWLNSPDGATFMSDGAAKSGINDIAYEKMCKSMLEPKFISAVGRMGDAYEIYQLLRQPMDEEFANYFEGQDIDEPSSTPGYAGGGRTTDASSTSAPPPESSGQDGEKALAAAGASSGQPSAALQVDADSVLSHGGASNDSDMLTGLSSDQALTAQSGRMDPVASRTASVTQSREGGENSSTISNLNELPATLDKDSTDGASSGPPSSAQLDDVGNEEGDST